MNDPIHQCCACGQTEDITRHHLQPRSTRPKGTHSLLADLCVPCHVYAHRIWKNKDLADLAPTPEALGELIRKARADDAQPGCPSQRERRMAKKERRRKVKEWLRTVNRQYFGSGR